MVLKNYSEDDIALLSALHHKIMHATLSMPYSEKYPGLNELSVTEISVLGMIADGDNIMMKDISDALGMTKSTLTGVIDRLERRGLIKRTICQRDRRSFSLILTEAGGKVQREHIEMENEMYGEFLSALETPDNVADFFRLTRIIVSHIK